MNENEVKKFAKKFLNEINQHDSIIIFHHIRPDGDCLGSQQGLRIWIQEKFPNKKVYCMGSNEGLFNFLNFKFNKVPSKKILDNALGIVVDANYSNRIVNNEIILNKELKTIIRIDHHPENDDIDYKLRFVDSSYSSTAEQITHLINIIDKKISKDISIFLYLGIYTDSGRFFYDYTSQRTHDLTSFLFNSGFDFFDLHKKLAKRTMNDVKFNQHVLANFKTHKNVIYYFVTLNDIKKLKIKDTSSNRVDFLANIEGYDIWIFFIENKDGSIRVRLRSSKKDISKLAKKYNGGGHKKAAGAIIYDKNKIKEIVEAAAKLRT